MRVLMINGSPKANGNTAAALREMEKIFTAEGVETEIVHVGNQAVRSCIACGKCAEAGRCVFDDIVNETAPKLEACDGLVVGSPAGRAVRSIRRAEQVLHDFRDAGSFQPILEQRPWQRSRRSGAG